MLAHTGSTAHEPRNMEEFEKTKPIHYGIAGCGSVLLQAVILATMGSFNFGYGLASMNTSMSFVGTQMRWCPHATNPTLGNRDCPNYTLFSTLISSGVFIGASIGCFVGGCVVNFGRRTAMIIMNSMFILGALLSASAEGFASLLIARIVAGLAVGLSTVCVPMFISEIAPSRIRGFYGVFHQLQITMGIFIVVLLGLAFGEPDLSSKFVQLTQFQQIWWRVLLAVPVAICIPVLVLYMSIFASETPRRLIEEGHTKQAEELLRIICNPEDVEEELSSMKKVAQEEKLLQKASLSLWAALQNPQYKYVIFVSCVLSAFQQLTGINVLMACSNKLYETAGLGAHATKLSVIMTSINLGMTFPPIWLLDRVGRRSLLLIGTVGQAASLGCGMIAVLVDYKNTASQYTAVCSTFGFVVFFAIGYGPVLWIYLHEIFPKEIKLAAAGFASAINWVATLITVIPANYLLTDDPRVVFTLFTAMNCIAAVFVFIFIKETKGLSITDSPYIKKVSDVTAQQSVNNGPQMVAVSDWVIDNIDKNNGEKKRASVDENNDNDDNLQSLDSQQYTVDVDINGQ